MARATAARARCNERRCNERRHGGDLFSWSHHRVRVAGLNFGVLRHGGRMVAVVLSVLFVLSVLRVSLRFDAVSRALCLFQRSPPFFSSFSIGLWVSWFSSLKVQLFCDPIPSHPTPPHPIPSHPTPSHTIPSHPIPSHSIPPHSTPSHSIPPRTPPHGWDGVGGGMGWDGVGWGGVGWGGMGWGGVGWDGIIWDGMEWNGVEWNVM